MNTAPAAQLTRSLGGVGALMVTLSALSPTIGVLHPVRSLSVALHGRGRWAHRGPGE